MPDDIERIKIQYPCLLTVQKDICQPRLPSYLKKKATANKKIKILTLQDMHDKEEGHYGLSASPTQVQKIFPPVSDKVQEHWLGDSQEISDRLYKKLLEKKFLS